jgi:hypothetical protein
MWGISNDYYWLGIRMRLWVPVMAIRVSQLEEDGSTA